MTVYFAYLVTLKRLYAELWVANDNPPKIDQPNDENEVMRNSKCRQNDDNGAVIAKKSCGVGVGLSSFDEVSIHEILSIHKLKSPLHHEALRFPFGTACWRSTVYDTKALATTSRLRLDHILMRSADESLPAMDHIHCYNPSDRDRNDSGLVVYPSRVAYVAESNHSLVHVD
jgi:hypothetical protein